jgi:ArsR family transcriptional regulator, arsenate/arsenite/antimonite-responsive transcriptional repressor
MKENKRKKVIQTDTAKRLTCLKALSDENRLAIVSLLGGGEICVCEIWSALDLPQNLVSHHLAVLKRAGLVSSRKDGLKVFYAIDRACMQKLQSLLTPIFRAYADKT